MQKIQGFVEAGNTTLTISGAAGTITRKVEGSFPSATITVFNAGTVTVSTIYADNALTPKANPFTASADGTWFFYAADGTYDVQFSGGSIAAPFTIGALQAFDVQRPNLVRMANQFPGSTMGAKITAAHADLPATGGTIDCRGMEGNQVISSAVAITLPNVTLLFGASTVSISALTTASGNNFAIVGNGTTFTFPIGQAIGIQMFRLTGTYATVSGCVFDGNKANLTQPDVGGSWNSGAPRIYYTPIDAEAATDVHIIGNRFVNVSTSSINLNNCGRVYIESNTFVDCYMDPIFSNLGSGQTSQYIRIDGNVIKNIHYAGFSYGNGMIVDANDIEVTNNIIDTTDRSAMKPTDVAQGRIYVAGNICRNISLNDGFAGMSVQTGPTTDVTYANNILSNLGGGGIAINGLIGSHMARVQIIGNKVFTTGAFGGATNQQGITMLYTDSANVIGNELDGCAVGGIRLFDCTDVLVSGNQIRNTTGVSGDAIDIAGAAGSNRVAITNNMISTTGRNGLIVEDATTNLTVARNTIRSTGAVGIQINNTAGVVDIIENEVYTPTTIGVSCQVSARIIRNKVFSAGTFGYALTSPSWLDNISVGAVSGIVSFSGTFTTLSGTYYDSDNQRVAIGPSFTAPATSTIHIKDATAATGVTRVLMQSGAAQVGNYLMNLIDNAGNDGMTYYPLASPTIVLNRADSGKIDLSFRANNTVKAIIGLAAALNDIGSGANAGDFVVRTATAATGLVVSTNGVNGCHVYTGSGSPEGSLVGNPGDFYLNASGGSGTTAYVKISGAATNTGWKGVTNA